MEKGKIIRNNITCKKLNEENKKADYNGDNSAIYSKRITELIYFHFNLKRLARRNLWELMRLRRHEDSIIREFNNGISKKKISSLNRIKQR